MIRYEPVRFRDIFPLAGPPVAGWWQPLAERATDAAVTPSGAHGLIRALGSIEGHGAVILPAYTCDRVLSAVLAGGDTPRFVDVDEGSGAFHWPSLEKAVSAGAKAIILTPLFGAYPDRKAVLDLARQHGVAVVEDRAVTIWAPLADERPADFAAFSFGRGKPIALGTGGMVVAWSGARLREPTIPGTQPPGGPGLSALVKGWLWNGRWTLEASRLVSRLRPSRSPAGASHPARGAVPPAGTSRALVQAVAHLVARTDIGALAAARARVLDMYLSGFRRAGLVELAESAGRRLSGGIVSQALALRCPDRNRVLQELRLAGVDIPAYWQYAIGTSFSGDLFPGASTLARELVFLPLHSKVHEGDVQAVTTVLKRYEAVAFS